MKKIINVCLVLLLSWMSATAQIANPFISMGTFPAVVVAPSGGGAGGNSTLQVTAGNAGNDNIVTNSLEITITVGVNAEIITLAPGPLAAGSDVRWTVFSVTPGPGGTIKLRNTGAAPFLNFDLGTININIRGVAGGAGNIQGNIAYLFGPNAALGTS